MERIIHSEEFELDLQNNFNFFKITPIEQLRQDIRSLGVTNLKLIEKIVAIILDPTITSAGDALSRIRKTNDSTTNDTRSSENSNSTSNQKELPQVIEVKDLKEATPKSVYQVSIVFKSSEGYNQFKKWHQSVRQNYAKDLVAHGFFNALNDQQQRKTTDRVPLFSDIVVTEKERKDRDPLLPNAFTARILPSDIEIQYKINGNITSEKNMPVVILEANEVTIELEQNFVANAPHSRAQTHNFVRYLAYHCGILNVIPPLDEQVLLQAFHYLVAVKGMIGIGSLIDNMKKEFKLFSHPTGSPRGVLLWGPPGTGKTFLISTLLFYLGVESVSMPLAAGDFLKGIVGESELMINELARRANAVPWMIVALSIDEIDGLAPSRQGPSASGGKIDMISVLLSIIGGNKDTRNLVLFGATNRYESMDEAFLRRMNIKLFVGRPSAEARKEWVQKKLLHKKFELQLPAEKAHNYLAEVSKLTVNFSNDAMRVFINFLETYGTDFVEQKYIVTEANYDQFHAATINSILSVCIAERIVIAESYLPKWIEQWHKLDSIIGQRCPSYARLLSYASPDANRTKYFKALPRLIIDLNAKNDQIQLKESRADEDITTFLNDLEMRFLVLLDDAKCVAKLTEISVVGDLSNILDALVKEHTEFSKLRALAVRYFIRDGKFCESAAVMNSVETEFGKSHEYAAKVKNMWLVASILIKVGEAVDSKRVILALRDTDEASRLRRRVKEFISAARVHFSRGSKVKTIGVKPHVDAGDFDHKEVLYLLFKFVVRGDLGCFHYIDAASLYRKGITEETAAIKYIAAAVEEASQYPSAMVAIDLDSVSEVHKEISGLKKEMKTPHTELSGGSFGPTISYRPQKSGLMNMVIELAKSNTPVWLAIISKHPFLTNKIKETLEWWTEEERAEQDKAAQRERDSTVDKLCNLCGEYYTEVENKLSSCGRHKNPDLLFIDDHFEDTEKKKLKAYTKDQSEDQIQLNNIPRNKVHYFCCGRSIDDKGEIPCKHIGEPIKQD
jgi:hypothetical protein